MDSSRAVVIQNYLDLWSFFSCKERPSPGGQVVQESTGSYIGPFYQQSVLLRQPLVVIHLPALWATLATRLRRERRRPRRLEWFARTKRLYQKPYCEFLTSIGAGDQLTLSLAWELPTSYLNKTDNGRHCLFRQNYLKLFPIGWWHWLRRS